tara:strand:+ start:3351 stop:3617 length:267 start_codon:yes stop_codon:yes gene_type:complete
MTQSLINNGIEKNTNDNLHANPKWVSAKTFKARPLNKSGVPRMELARTKGEGTQFLVIFNPETGVFTSREPYIKYSAGSLEIRIIQIR